MSEQNYIQIQAKTLDQALGNAAKSLGVDKDQIGYELISQTDAGLLSFLGGRRVEIKAWKNDAQKSSGQIQRAAATSATEDLTETEISDLVEDLRSFCERVCEFIAGDEVKVKADVVDMDRLVLDVDSEYIATQMSKNARLAESMEHILRKKPRYLKRELPFRIFVDAKGLRAGRETELIEMAKDLSLKVAENQRPIVLNYKSSYDRKIIHMALDKDDRVYTKSIGTGANRKLMILPAREQGDGEVHA